MRSRPCCQKKSGAISLFLLLALLAVPVALRGQETAPGEAKKKPIARFDLENGFERYFFYTKYQIGGLTYSRTGVTPYYFPISELKFPLDVFMIYANLNLNFVDRVNFHFNVRKNIHNKVGKMEDSDWYPYPGLKTTYSESTARLNALITEADVTVRLFTVSFFSLVLGGGFTHQYLFFWCSDTEQKDILSMSYIRIPFKTQTYDLRYYMTTVQLTPVFTFIQQIEIALAIRFSPYLRAHDIDDHKLRAKKSVGDSTGWGFMPSLRVRYMFANRIFLAAQLDYLLLNTQGHQTQSFYLPTAEASGIPGWAARTENRLKSEQLSVGLGAGYSFEM